MSAHDPAAVELAQILADPVKRISTLYKIMIKGDGDDAGFFAAGGGADAHGHVKRAGGGGVAGGEAHHAAGQLVAHGHFGRDGDAGGGGHGFKRVGRVARGAEVQAVKVHLVNLAVGGVQLKGFDGGHVVSMNGHKGAHLGAGDGGGLGGLDDGQAKHGGHHGGLAGAGAAGPGDGRVNAV